MSRPDQADLDLADAEEDGSGGPASRITLLLGLGATVAVLAVAGFLAVDRGQDEPPAAEGEAPQTTLQDRVTSDEQQPLPEMDLDGFGDDGEAVSTRDYAGQPLVLNFWATWCPPCVEEMPALQEVAETIDGLAMLGVNIQDDHEQAAALVDELGITYDLAVDDDASLFGAVEGFGMPTTLLVDPEGTIQFRHTGPLDADQLRDLVDEHLGVG